MLTEDLEYFKSEIVSRMESEIQYLDKKHSPSKEMRLGKSRTFLDQHAGFVY